MSAIPQISWGIGNLISAIGAQLVNELRLAGHAALVDGGIAFGSFQQRTRKSPPRVVFTPASSTYAGPVYGAEPAGVRRVQPVLQSLATDKIVIEAHVWGAAEPPDDGGGDFDDCRYLIHQIIRCCQPRIMGGIIRPIRTVYDPEPISTLGHHGTLFLEFATPVVDTLEMYLPMGTVGQITIENEVPEVAEVINLPATST